MAKVAFLGLGVMGFPMAGHLARKGHDVTVYNRSAVKAERWVSQFGGRMAATQPSPIVAKRNLARAVSRCSALARWSLLL